MKVRIRHTLAFLFFSCVFRPIMFFLYGYRCKRYKKKSGQPYLVVGNHVAQLDPFFVSFAIRGAVYYIATDLIFTNKWYTKVMVYLLNPIPITKGTSDIQTVRDCKSIVAQGGTVGLFPAGNTTYSGEEPHISDAIGKMAKLLKVPVLCFKIRGMYGVAPRWCAKRRRGKSFGEVTREISLEEVNSLSAQEITNIIKQNISVTKDELALGEYKSKQSAEHLERVLCICPKCKTNGALLSSGQMLRCTHCGLEARYTERLTFEYSKEGEGMPQTVREWFVFQLEFLKSQNQEYFVPQNFTTTGNSLYKKERRKQKELLCDNQTLVAYHDRLELSGQNGTQVFPFSSIKDMAIQTRNTLLIYAQDQMLILKAQPKSNHYKFMACYYINHAPEKINHLDL